MGWRLRLLVLAALAGCLGLFALIRLLAGKYAMMNFIPFNTVDGLSFRRPAWAHAAALADRLRQHGIIACLRDSAGQDIDGGCGQLRARSLSA